MKRFSIFATITVVTAFTFGLLRAKENGMLKAFPSLQARRSEMVNAIAKEEAQQTLLRQTIASQKARRLLVSQEPPFSTPLTAWLLSGDFSNVPRSLVPELRSALALPPKLSSDFILISKSSLRVLSPPAPGRNDKLPDSLCGLLSLSPDQRQDIESALSDSRHEFGDWAKQNFQRQGPQGETLVRYTIPASDGADDITNQLMAKLSATMGAERTDLFYLFADAWFQLQNGYFGAVTNTLSVLRQAGTDGQPALFYQLSREGAQSSMSEGPGLILPQFFPPTWRNVFPGGWAEVAQRERFELPPQQSGN